MIEEHLFYISLNAQDLKHTIRFPSQVHLKSQENWYVSLSTAILFPAVSTEYVSVILNELEEKTNNLFTKQVISNIQSKRGICVLHRKKDCFFKLTNHFLSQFRILITDPDKKPIPLAHTSCLCFKIVKMPQKFHEIQYTIEKKGSKDLAKFQDILPHPVDLNPHGIWKIALSSIYFPNPALGTKDHLAIKVNQTGIPSICILSNHLLYDKEKFVNDINTQIKKHLKFPKTDNNFGFLVRNNKIVIISGFAISLTLSRRLGYLLGFTDGGYEQAETLLIIKPKEPYIFPNTISLYRDKIRMMKMTSDIVSPAIYNSSYEHIIRLIHVPQSDDNYFYQEFEDLEFHPIIPTTLNKIPIKFTTFENMPVYFGRPENDRMILHFVIKYFEN